MPESVLSRTKLPDRDLMVFMKNMSKFDDKFSEMLASGLDFTLRFEVRGNKGVLMHCRVSEDGFERMRERG